MMRSLKPWLLSCMNASDIDWSGKLPLTATGAIDRRKAESNGMFNAGHIRPMPTLAKESEQYRELLEAIAMAREAIRPAIAAEIGFELKRLSVWCPMANRQVIDFKLMLNDALSDLADLPLDLLRKACLRYRNDASPQHDFFPRPVKLRVLIEDELRKRKTWLYRLERLLEYANEPPKLPAPVTYEELEDQAQKSLEIGKMLHGFARKPPPDRSPAEERAELARTIEAKIKEALQEHHITQPESVRFRQKLLARFSDVFKPTEPERDA